MPQKVDEGWRDRQKKVFTNWLNNKLRDRIADGKVPPVFDINNDLKNGYVLYHLLEVPDRYIERSSPTHLAQRF
jgi:hypothetical protein